MRSISASIVECMNLQNSIGILFVSGALCDQETREQVHLVGSLLSTINILPAVVVKHSPQAAPSIFSLLLAFAGAAQKVAHTLYTSVVGVDGERFL